MGRKLTRPLEFPWRQEDWDDVGGRMEGHGDFHLDTCSLRGVSPTQEWH
jgi:hypothetical protein